MVSLLLLGPVTLGLLMLSKLAMKLLNRVPGHESPLLV